ncbi:hypothetical protein RI129_001756 [Pyrocoelia pectoralis]|uniref:Serpin domain-containing protein n=1 Tax=Pyrocoelia pectoralis TaxID=417401 RepID=A0AAN7VL85_9COLE
MKILLPVLILFSSSSAEEFLLSNLNFSADVYKEQLKAARDNFLVCPFSAEIVLSLASLGARGNTAEELTKGLRLPNDNAKIRNIFQTLSVNFEEERPYQLRSANKIYIAEGLTINKDYQAIAVDSFKADVENINFNDSEKAAETINEWIELKTNNKIRELVNKDSFSESTAFVLVNAMYFNGLWLHEFGKTFGLKIPFYVTKAETVDVEVFGGRNKFNHYYNDKLNAAFLELPFVGNDIAMTFVLPKEKDGLKRLEMNIAEIFAKQPYLVTDIEVHLPKFKMESRVDFKSILKSLGVHDAFTSVADFKGISDTNVRITEILQKTFIEVNERGATAAAATESTAEFLSVPKETFIADHPFLFFLKHDKYGILFVGRYINPYNL